MLKTKQIIYDARVLKISCPKVITPRWIITQSANIRRNFKGINEMGLTISAQKSSESSNLL